MSEIQRSVQLLADVLVGKNQDYTANRGEFYNFEETAKFVGGGMDPLSVMLTQLGIKITRLDSLRLGYDERVATNFEGIKDSLLDLAGYAIIAHAYLSAQETEGEAIAMDWGDQEDEYEDGCNCC